MLPRGASALALTTGLLLGSLFWSTDSAAQEEPERGSIALNQFDPSPAGDAFFNVPSPYAYGEYFEPRAQITLDYAEEPLRLFDDERAANVVGRQVFMNVSASAAIMDRMLISLMLPVALIQSGDDPVIQGTQAVSPSALSDS